MSKKIRKPIKKEKDFSGKILKILSQNANKPFNYKQIGAKLELDDTSSRNQIIKDLKILAAQKKIIETEPGKYLVKAISPNIYIECMPCNINCWQHSFIYPHIVGFLIKFPFHITLFKKTKGSLYKLPNVKITQITFPQGGRTVVAFS